MSSRNWSILVSILVVWTIKMSFFILKNATSTSQHTQILVAYPLDLWWVLVLTPRKPFQIGSMQSAGQALVHHHVAIIKKKQIQRKNVFYTSEWIEADVCTSGICGNGLSCNVINSFAASADIWYRPQKFAIFDLESKLFELVIARTLDGDMADNCVILLCFGGVGLNSLIEGWAFCRRFGSAIAVA